MKSIASVLALLTAGLVAPVASAQTFVFGDATWDKNGGVSGIGGGRFFDRGRWQPGFLADIYHQNQFARFAPNAEVMALLGWNPNPNWYVSFGAGGGAAFNNDNPPTWTVRGLIVVTGLRTVAFRWSLFSQWTSADDSFYFFMRVGPSIQVDTMRVFPNLGVNFNAPTDGTRVSGSISPGVLVIWTPR